MGRSRRILFYVAFCASGSVGQLGRRRGATFLATLHRLGCRAYVAQMEALRKHRNGGKQTVTVQHVNVAEGGQAIVGNVETGGEG